MRHVWDDADTWRRDHGGILHLHQLFCLLGVSVLNLMPDCMHILELGVDHHIWGNVLFELCYVPEYFPTIPTIAERCDEIWRRVGHVILTSQYRSKQRNRHAPRPNVCRRDT